MGVRLGIRVRLVNLAFVFQQQALLFIWPGQRAPHTRGTLLCLLFCDSADQLRKPSEWKGPARVYQHRGTVLVNWRSCVVSLTATKKHVTPIA